MFISVSSSTSSAMDHAVGIVSGGFWFCGSLNTASYSEAAFTVSELIESSSPVCIIGSGLCVQGQGQTCIHIVQMKSQLFPFKQQYHHK